MCFAVFLKYNDFWSFCEISDISGRGRKCTVRQALSYFPKSSFREISGIWRIQTIHQSHKFCKIRAMLQKTQGLRPGDDAEVNDIIRKRSYIFPSTVWYLSRYLRFQSPKSNFKWIEISLNQKRRGVRRHFVREHWKPSLVTAVPRKSRNQRKSSSENRR